MLTTQLESITQIHALVMGDFMLDEYIIGNVRRISPEAPVPVLEVQRREQRLGGAGNVVHNLAALGATVRAVACIGVDEAGNRIYNLLNEKSVDLRYVCQMKKQKTCVKTRIVSREQQVLRYDEESNEEVPEEYVCFISENLTDLFDGVDVLILSDYGKGNLPHSVCHMMIEQAYTYGIPVIVDPKGKDYMKYKGAAVCTPNMQEFIMASGVGESPDEEQIKKYGRKMCLEKEFENLLITRSEKGITWINGRSGEKIDFPALKKEVIDVTGAGDTVIAIISLGVVAGISIKECCLLANKAAAVVVSRFGTSALTLKELKNMEDGRIQEKNIFTMEEVGAVAQKLKKQGKRIVFTNGCFDLLHAGHIASLQQARNYGDVLIVGLNGDESVRRLKGQGRPVMGQQDRAKMLNALTMVDYVVVFHEDTPEKVIGQILPDVLVKGRDWEGKAIAGETIVSEYGGCVKFVDLEKDISTSKIIEKVMGSSK